MNAPALTRRESLWADEPVMRDGRVLDQAHKALEVAADLQVSLINAVTSSMPDAWLSDAERAISALRAHIKSARSMLRASKAVAE